MNHDDLSEEPDHTQNPPLQETPTVPIQRILVIGDEIRENRLLNTIARKFGERKYEINILEGYKNFYKFDNLEPTAKPDFLNELINTLNTMNTSSPGTLVLVDVLWIKRSNLATRLTSAGLRWATCKKDKTKGILISEVYQ